RSKVADQETLVDKSGSERFPILAVIDDHFVAGNLSRGGLNEIQQQTEERGFSGSVVSDQAEALSFLDMQIVNLQNRVSVISFAEIFYFYQLKKFVVQVCHSVF